MTEKSENNLEHPSLYTRTTESATWIFDGKNYLWKTEKLTYEWDKNLKDWVKVKTENKNETPQDLGMAKSLNFVVCFPDSTEQEKAFGKMKKTPRILAQFGVVKVRTEKTHTEPKFSEFFYIG